MTLFLALEVLQQRLALSAKLRDAEQSDHPIAQISRRMNGASIQLAQPQSLADQRCFDMSGTDGNQSVKRSVGTLSSVNGVRDAP